jgi:cyclophilin family peptidyl-prolyl cis-trans isomerase
MVYLCLGLAAVLGVFALTSGESRAAEGDKPVVVLDTSMGAITLELDPSKAPGTVDNFLKYVDAGHYDGLIFHRVIDSFMIQGGGMDDRMRQKPTRDPIKLEYNLKNTRGTIAMARTGNPNSATSQFFINLVDNSRNLGPGGVDPYGYTAFGHVTGGMDVVDAIGKVATGAGDVPQKPVYIKSAKRKPKA